VPDDWRKLLDAVRDRVRGNREEGSARSIVVYVLGQTDAGKSTCGRWLQEELGVNHPTALVELDPGQGTIGPPSTVGARVVEDSSEDSRGSRMLWFVGDTNPVHHLLEMASAAGRLLEFANRRADCVVVDSCGLVDRDLGREYQLHTMELLDPDLVVSIGDVPREHGLADALRRGRWNLHHLERVPSARRRSPDERRTNRIEGYRKALRGSRVRSMELRNVAVTGRRVRLDKNVEGMVIGLCRTDGTLISTARGVNASKTEIRIHTTEKHLDDVAFVRLGTARVPDEAL
jgi:polynucleotide 5'-kinase involved in rRNA processing